MRTIAIHRAQGHALTPDGPEPVTIIIEETFPDFGGVDGGLEARRTHTTNATTLAEALAATLPGGTWDRLVAEMLRLHASKPHRHKATTMSYPAHLAEANAHRAWDAAVVEVDRVRDALRDLPRDGSVPHHLLVAGRLRLDNPTASYTELATIAGLTKDQVRSRIRQLIHLADQHRRQRCING